MGLPQWRLASRLARREVRRRPGRTLLVVALVAIPVFGMTVGSVLVRTADSNNDSVTREWRAGTDLVVDQFADAVSLSAAIPPGADVSSAVRVGWIPIVGVDGTLIHGVSIEDPGANPPSRPIAVTDGRLPEAGEVWLSGALADRLDVEVGDAVTLEHPSGTWNVAGTGRVDADFDRLAMLMPDLPVEQFTDGAVARTTLIDLADGASAESIEAVAIDLAEIVPQVMWRGQFDYYSPSDVEPLAWGWVAGAIALAATGVIVAAAFATSARRQLVTIGLLSANGAPERVVRRSLALQGGWTGLAGSLLGAFGGVAALLVARGTIESINTARLAAYRFSAFDLAVIILTGTAAATIAALVPARSASRVPVLAALAGRRPLGVVPRRLVPVGVAMFALGAFLLFLAASSTDGGNDETAAAVLGGVLVLAGMCCCSPLAIDRMSRASAAIGGTWRFAGRSLGRTRTRSAAVVTAIAVTGAVGVAGSVWAMDVVDVSEDARFLPIDAVVLQPAALLDARFGSPGRLPPTPVPDEVVARITSILPGATTHPRRVAVWEPPAADDVGGLGVVVADEATIDLYELSPVERAALEAEGALLLNAWNVVDGEAKDELTIDTADGQVIVPYAVRDHLVGRFVDPDEGPDFDGVSGIDELMMTEQAARRAGFEVVEFGGTVRAAAPLTQEQRDAITRTFQGTPLDDWYRDAGDDHASASAWWAALEQGEGDASLAAAARQAIAFGIVLALVLAVVAIGLALAATESRDERDVLVAVGAAPRTLRSLAGSKAVVLTVTGVALAIPTGLIPTYLVRQAVDEPLHVPWLTLAGLVVAVPLIAGGAALLASVIAQRLRPVRSSNFAYD